MLSVIGNGRQGYKRWIEETEHEAAARRVTELVFLNNGFYIMYP